MTCSDCQQREARVQITQIINNEKTVLSLCKECAAARGFHSPLENMPFPLADVLSGLSNVGTAGQKIEVPSDLQCDQCGLTIQQFTDQGRFGCGNCYRTFRSFLEPMMRKIHGASIHHGRTPSVTVATNPVDTAKLDISEAERLETELKKAIESEDFERAAELRDKLKGIKVAPVGDDN
jgi:protein arginine kinase activator